MKILIATTIWQRHELTRIVLSYYKGLKDSGMDIELLACGSEGAVSREVAESSGWNYVGHMNYPLSQKHNNLFKEASKYPHDAIMLIGSDDLVSRETIEYYQENYSADSEYMLGLNTLHFYSTKLNKLIYFKGFEQDKTGRVTMGAGRIFSKAILEKLNYHPWGDAWLNRGLDTACSRWLIKNRISEREIKMSDIPGAMILDVKTEVNITFFDRLLLNCIECPVEEAINKFPDQMESIIKLK